MMACLKRRKHSENHQGIFASFSISLFLLMTSFTSPVSFIISLVASFGQASKGHASLLQLVTNQNLSFSLYHYGTHHHFFSSSPKIVLQEIFQMYLPLCFQRHIF
jgi:hypothetical protein